MGVAPGSAGRVRIPSVGGMDGLTSMYAQAWSRLPMGAVTLVVVPAPRASDDPRDDAEGRDRDDR